MSWEANVDTLAWIFYGMNFYLCTLYQLALYCAIMVGDGRLVMASPYHMQADFYTNPFILNRRQTAECYLLHFLTKSFKTSYINLQNVRHTFHQFISTSNTTRQLILVVSSTILLFTQIKPESRLTL